MIEKTPIRVEGAFQTALIVDDHPLFCDALSMTLRAGVGIATVATAGALEEALERLSAGDAPDVILLDLNLPDVNGLDGLVRLTKMCPQTPIVIVSSMAEPRVVRSAIRVGAAGFVPKHSTRDTFRKAFEHIAGGEIYAPEGAFSEGDANMPLSAREDALIRLSHLTRQQARILQLICEGQMNKQIAYELTIAETTVKAHVTAIMRKLGVQSRTQAVLIAQEANFNSLLSGS
ncbi:response regulator transcription factor [Celeribacter baekdonensis]|jgi:DNA-binding NarL/FixJ family response regulator|uniref:DNA-binding response regulator n=1 Tax=Celeribacter baekdonensis TaxID=875171 RepID=A0A2R4LZT3_9RHOB|nr:response regulator transcription factor [Celeribacter baekdonensis]AVW90435.1 DNA-binding response regulator [Celeribacter baekdonensis]|tara:strand:+ start:233911 stop:234606 length:696 start_codon:yes stop_codon:yes gene_type:complete